MSLAKLDEKKENLLNPKITAYVSELFQKIGAVTGQSIVSEGLEIQEGDFADFHKQKPEKFMLSKVAWDGNDGRIFVLSSVKLSIILSGFIKQMSPEDIKAKVEAIDFDAELVESYNKISDQFRDATNQILAAKIDKNIKLTLEKTAELPEDGSQNADLIEEGKYLFATLRTKVADFEPQVLVLLVSESLIDTFFGLSQSKPSKAAAAVDIKGDLAEIKASQVMEREYPSLSIHKSIGDAFDLMQLRNVESLPLLDGFKVVRMVSRNNAKIHRTIFFDFPGQDERIKRQMQQSLLLVNADQKLLHVFPEDSLSSVIKTMIKFKLHSIPVTNEEGQFCGMMTSHQILSLLADRAA